MSALRLPVLAALLVLAVAVPARAQITLDFTDPLVVWPTGSMSHTFVGDPVTLPGLCDPATNCIAIRITFSTMAAGSWAVAGGAFNTPYEDGNPNPVCGPNGFWFFGVGCDLGVQFDPAANQGQSPITIFMEFLDPANTQIPKPVLDLSFEISDIDWDPGPPPNQNVNFRRDQVVVTSDAGPPILMGCPVTCSIAGNVATAIIGQSTAQSGNGTAIADFGPASVSTVTVTYNEASGQPNPAIRGIGLFFNMTMAKIPVELQSVTVD